MKKTKVIIVTCIIFSLISGTSYALIVHDPINAALDRLRNVLIENQYVQMVRNAVQQIEQLRRLYDEMRRFQSGIDSIIKMDIFDTRLFGGSSYDVTGNSIYDLGYEISSSIREIIGIARGTTSDYNGIKRALERVFGADPRSSARPYISYQEAQVGDSLAWAGETKRIAQETKLVGRMISDEAYMASPKGAARLTADALGKLLVTQAQIQENQSKSIELEANLLEAQTMDEKRMEEERLKYMKDFQEVLAGIEKL